MNIYDFTERALSDFFVENGEKVSRAALVFDALYRNNLSDFDRLPLNDGTKALLKGNFTFDSLETAGKKSGEGVTKYLFRLSDGNLIEAVLMRHDYGNGVCISTQLGCNMGCAFCESGRLKRVRNLTVGEMVGQVRAVWLDTGIKPTNVVLMGIGEPFDNFENVEGFLSIANSPHGFELGSKQITVSTSGVVPKIYDFAALPYRNNLAISLHAPNDELRSRLMPINRKYPLSELIKAAKHYSEKLNKRVTFEYIMLRGVNDSEECAKALSELIRGFKCYVNLIPYNETDGEFTRSSDAETDRFFEILKSNNVLVTLRHEFGGSISAACGQLRADYEKKRGGEDVHK